MQRRAFRDAGAFVVSSSPFKGEVRRGMGAGVMHIVPIPTPALPLKGREKPDPSKRVECAENSTRVVQFAPAWSNEPMQGKKARHAR